MFKEAYVKLKRGRTCNLWVIQCCPHCGKKHTHGAGSFDANPKDFLGHRLAHCENVKSNGYVLVEQKKQSKGK